MEVKSFLLNILYVKSFEKMEGKFHVAGLN